VACCQHCSVPLPPVPSSALARLAVSRSVTKTRSSRARPPRCSCMMRSSSPARRAGSLAGTVRRRPFYPRLENGALGLSQKLCRNSWRLFAMYASGPGCPACWHGISNVTGYLMFIAATHMAQPVVRDVSARANAGHGPPLSTRDPHGLRHPPLPGEWSLRNIKLRYDGHPGLSVHRAQPPLFLPTSGRRPALFSSAGRRAGRRTCSRNIPPGAQPSCFASCAEAVESRARRARFSDFQWTGEAARADGGGRERRANLTHGHASGSATDAEFPRALVSMVAPPRASRTRSSTPSGAAAAEIRTRHLDVPEGSRKPCRTQSI